MSAATAVIQIVGLFLVGHTIGPNGGLGAVAPRISCPGPAVNQRITSSAAAKEAMKNTGVGEHAALLMISFGDYISSSGWPPSVFETTKGRYLYVKLDGEQVRFIQNLGPATERTAGKTGASTSDLGLPHLGCCVDAELRPEYLPSTNYELAAAVLDLSNGSPSACTQPSSDGEGRQDTLVTFENGGTLTIEATNWMETKQITVKGTARVIVANAPSDVIPGTQACPGAHMHLVAYTAMMKPCSQAVDCPTSLAGNTPCNAPTIVDRVVPLPPLPFAITDASCSNHQWP